MCPGSQFLNKRGVLIEGGVHLDVTGVYLSEVVDHFLNTIDRHFKPLQSRTTSEGSALSPLVLIITIFFGVCFLKNCFGFFFKFQSSKIQ